MLRSAGFNIGGQNTPESETPVLPIIVGESAATAAFSKALFEAGVMATAITFPTVPQGKARVRTIMTSEHTPAMLERAAEILTSTAKRLGVL